MIWPIHLTGVGLFGGSAQPPSWCALKEAARGRRLSRAPLGAWGAPVKLGCGQQHKGVGFLLHGLIDHVVDGHFEAVQSLDEEIEKLEDLLFDQQPHDGDVQRHSLDLRKSLVTLRRVVLPCERLSTASCGATQRSFRKKWPRTSKASTTTYSEQPSGPSLGGTWLPPSWRRT